MAMAYNVNNTATQVLAAKQIKENIFMQLVHKNGYGVNQVEEVNASTVRLFKPVKIDINAREIGSGNNGGFFNNANAIVTQVSEYDLNLLYVFDGNVDIPEVQQDMVAINLFDGATKNLGGRCATEINASTIAAQLAVKYNAADTANAWTGLAVEIGTGDKANYDAFLAASTLLDDGDEANGIQSFPFDEREVIMRPSYRASLLGANGVIVGGSNYAQSMLAKGAVSPDAKKEWGTMYVGELDLTPCYVAPAALWKRAGAWVGSETAFDATEAIVCAASATDRGISTQDYIKVIDSPNGAGKRLQPKTRWGINVCYPKGIVPIVKNGTAAPAAQLTVSAPGSRA